MCVSGADHEQVVDPPDTCVDHVFAGYPVHDTVTAAGVSVSTVNGRVSDHGPYAVPSYARTW
jgi:hypothetical protein